MAAQARTMLFPLAALCLPALANIPRTPLLIAEKPHQGGASFAPALHRGPVAANPLIAPGMCECVCDFDRRSRNTGKERDAETGLDYFGARYYGGAQGRFTSADAHGFTRRTLRNPQKWNKYAYVLNNPLGYVDPNGLEELKVSVRSYIPYKTTWMFGTYNGGDKTNTELRVETRRTGKSPVLGLTESVHPTQKGQMSQELNGSTFVPDREATASKSATILGWGYNENTQFFAFHQDARNPLAPLPEDLTPGVTADLDFEFDEDANWISVNGHTSQFPAFDITVTRANGTTVPVYHREPWFNNTLLLFLPHFVDSGKVPLKEKNPEIKSRCVECEH